MRKRTLAISLIISAFSMFALTSCMPVEPVGNSSLMIGHSFFAPIAKGVPAHAERLELQDYSQHVEFSGGDTGAPEALWNDDNHRTSIQAVLDTGSVDVFGMTLEGSNLSTRGYELWIDYALDKNPDTTFYLAIPWADYPGNYSSAASYEAEWKPFHDGPWHDLVESLRAKYPGVEIVCVPHGQAAISLRNLFDAGELPGIVSLIGDDPTTALFRDNKGHGFAQTGILHDLAELIFLDAIYGVDLDTYDYDSGYGIDLKALAKSIMDEHDLNF